ncbi:MAG: fructose-1,6-bisphosphatase, partial [Candidatus Altiarchaeales archaeon]|nr:fructose-1,6-bisphosphatase [Candidatus Altiarchaeales archaeon]
MQPGENMRAAMYMLYGPMTVLTLTVKEGVQIFALNNEDEYVMIEKDIRIPEGKLYASGALKKDWTPRHRKFIDYLEDEGYKLRYSGSFVADVHQYLKYGGMFSYPAFKGHEMGKLRLLFEANPLGFMVSEAGGRISDGERDILTIMPEKIDHRVPIYIGSKGIIERMEEMFKK